MTREETAKQLGRFLETWERDGFGKYAVELRATEVLIGCAGLQLATWFREINGEVEMGWRFHPHYWGRGYATEAVLASMHIGFADLGADRIVAVVEPANLASSRLAERAGLQFVRETIEPELNKVLGVYVVDRQGFEDLDRARAGTDPRREHRAAVESPKDCPEVTGS
jgi:RimJ/RimL family protein N-acetyltransferase